MSWKEQEGTLPARPVVAPEPLLPLSGPPNGGPLSAAVSSGRLQVERERKWPLGSSPGEKRGSGHQNPNLLVSHSRGPWPCPEEVPDQPVSGLEALGPPKGLGPGPCRPPTPVPFPLSCPQASSGLPGSPVSAGPLLSPCSPHPRPCPWEHRGRD